MKRLSNIALIAAALAFTGCATSSRPYTVSGPVSVTGPVTVSGQVTVTSPVSESARRRAAGLPEDWPPAPSGSAVMTPGTYAGPQTFTTQVGSPPNGAPTSHTGDNGVQVEIKTETFSTSKSPAPNGQVLLRKTVVAQPVSAAVTLNREEYVVERTPAPDGAVPATPFGEVVATMPLQKEVAGGVITPKVIETVRLKKVIVQDTNVITGTIRTEKFDVQRTK
jgi:uncharacterized protein (TIGR02271 family)